MAKKSKGSNWDKLKDREFSDKPQYRDVHGLQQLDRVRQGELTSKTPRIIGSVLIGLFGLIGGFVVMRILCMLLDGIGILSKGGAVFGENSTLNLSVFAMSWKYYLFSVFIGCIVWVIAYNRLMVSWKIENAMNDSSDINPHMDDQYVMLPEEMQREFDWFPNNGAHSSVQVSSILGHNFISNKGLKSIDMVVRHDKDVVVELDDGSTDIIYKGSPVVNDDGSFKTKKLPMINEEHGQQLFTDSGIPVDQKKIRTPFDVSKIPYNPADKSGKRPSRDKLSYDTVGELINNDWEIPWYEVQRPSGAYIVDTAPVNTMMLAITRAGKGQTFIEPTLDMWTREKRANNIIVNDPKGELLVKFFIPATYRGFEIVQFNLINAMKTDIYNPLGYAASAAREGDFTKAASYVEAIGDIFFPKDGGDDPMWPNAANNAFKRSAFGLIDYYLEEEKELRKRAERLGMDPKVLTQKIDDLWGKVTLYNAYQLFVVLSAKKSSDADYIKIDDDEVVKEKDYLTLFFDATAKLPANKMRNLVRNTDNALRAMAGSDKTIASVYGIALTAMSFFTDPTISTLTSGKPSQNFDAQGLSFPRRVGVQFASEYLSRYRMIGMLGIWTAYDDDKFTQKSEGDFYHEQLIDTTGWARYFFDGKFKNRVSYLKLEVRNPETQLLIKTFYFELELLYKTSLNGKSYVKDPVLGTKIIKDGILREMRQRKDGSFFVSNTLVERKYRDFSSEDRSEKTISVPAFSQYSVAYTERPKMVFLITPPHLMSYAKLILILVKQAVDMSFDRSYITKPNQKPLYKTRFMLDELGNLQSEGHGIPALPTMLSIGLGQDQQFTLILQTLQQLRDVYGESVDKVIQGNTSNIVFLKSTDDAMLDTLVKLSGIKHESLIEQKTITQNLDAVVNKVEGKMSYTQSTKERPVITFNDLLFIPERNSVVFRAGNSPIWNRNETVMPMSWSLLGNTIKIPGKKFSLQTVPTLSAAIDFDIKKNQPNFYAMLDKRLKQARQVDATREQYKDAYGYEEYQMEQLDENTLADELMSAINDRLFPIDDEPVWVQQGYSSQDEYIAAMDEMSAEVRNSDPTLFADFGDDSNNLDGEMLANVGQVNTELVQSRNELAREQAVRDVKLYAGGLLSRSHFVNASGSLNLSLSKALAMAYQESESYFKNDMKYRYDDVTGELRSSDGIVYIVSLSGKNKADFDKLQEAANSEDVRVFENQDYAGQDINKEEAVVYEVTDDFIRHLISLDSWSDIANGYFDAAMKDIYTRLYL